MISIIDSGKLVNTDVSPMVPRSCEMVGLSTDSKPTGVSVGNGWSFIEMDTGKVFFYNAEDEEWLEFAGSGGGGGQGGSGMLVINCDPATYTLDKTWAQSHAENAAVIIAPAEGVISRLYVTATTTDSVDYQVFAITAADAGATVVDFVTNSENGYPVINAGE